MVLLNAKGEEGRAREKKGNKKERGRGGEERERKMNCNSTKSFLSIKKIKKDKTFFHNIQI